jgi:hypothetical protein
MNPVSEQSDSGLSAEDAKLVTLARGARGRVGAPEGAALRDETGRTYSASTVSLDGLAISAVGLAVAQAASSGSRGIEAVVIVRAADEFTPHDCAEIASLGGANVPVFIVSPAGDVLKRATT